MHSYAAVSKAGRKEERQRELSAWATISFIRQDKIFPSSSLLLCFCGSHDSYIYQFLGKGNRQPMAGLAQLWFVPSDQTQSHLIKLGFCKPRRMSVLGVCSRKPSYLFKTWACNPNLFNTFILVFYPSERILLLWFWFYDLCTVNQLCGALNIRVCFHVYYKILMSMLTCLYQYYVRGWNLRPGMMLEIIQRKEAMSELWSWASDTLQWVYPKVFDDLFCTDQSASTKQQSANLGNRSLDCDELTGWVNRNDPFFIMLIQMVSCRVTNGPDLSETEGFPGMQDLQF